MLDTNLIIVDNIKAVVNKIKGWTENLYPMKYEEDLNRFSLTSNRNYNHPDILFENADGNNMTIDGSEEVSITGDGAKMRITPDAVYMQNGNDTAEVDGSNVMVYSSNNINLGTNNNTIMIDKSNGAVETYAGVPAVFSADTAYVELSNGDLIFNDSGSDPKTTICLGMTPDNIMAGERTKNSLYLGHRTPIGRNYTYMSLYDETHKYPDGFTLASGTTTATILCTTDNLSAGTWYFTYSVYNHSGTSFPNASRLGVALYNHKGVNSHFGENILCNGAAGAGGVQGSCIVHIPNGESGKCTLRAWQDSGNPMKVDFNVNFVRVG